MPQRRPVSSSPEQRKSTGAGSNNMTSGSPGTRLSNAAMLGMRSECTMVWLDRSLYERAESLYYVRLQEHQNGTTAPASVSIPGSRKSQKACFHSDLEACHHIVETVWVNKAVFDKAESRFVAESPKRLNSAYIPSSLPLLPSGSSGHALFDEGYMSQTPTPPTPASRPDNGLPFLPVPLQGVWLEKHQYDRAEAAFYQNLFCTIDHHHKPAALSEQNIVLEDGHSHVAKDVRPKKLEHQKPSDRGDEKDDCHFLHADSERVWLEKSCYAQAETCFYKAVAANARQIAAVQSSPTLK